jgi:hypothetical protein
MSTETATFDSTLRPEAVLDGFEALAAEKGWKLNERSDDQAQAKKGMNLRTWSEQIELSADRVEDDRTRVHVVVHARQIGHWGSHDEVIASIRERLSGEPVS